MQLNDGEYKFTIVENTSLIAEFIDVEHELIFNYGNYIGANPNIIKKVKHNNALNESITPIRNGYTFMGWITKDSNTKFDETKPVIKDMVLEASWLASLEQQVINALNLNESNLTYNTDLVGVYNNQDYVNNSHFNDFVNFINILFNHTDSTINSIEIANNEFTDLIDTNMGIDILMTLMFNNTDSLTTQILINNDLEVTYELIRDNSLASVKASNYESIIRALSIDEVKTIELVNDIVINATLEINKDIKLAGDYWLTLENIESSNELELMIINDSTVIIEDVDFNDGLNAINVINSNVTIDGTVNLFNQVIGGIKVLNTLPLSNYPNLIIEGFITTGEDYLNKPVVYIVGKTNNDDLVVIEDDFIYQFAYTENGVEEYWFTYLP